MYALFGAAWLWRRGFWWGEWHSRLFSARSWRFVVKSCGAGDAVVILVDALHFVIADVVGSDAAIAVVDYFRLD